MHHQPIDVGSQFIDELGLENKKVFWDIISRHQNIRGVIFGHVHQEYDEKFKGIRLISVPSTSMQFTPFSHELDYNSDIHGYRTITLNPDGSVSTKVHYIRSVE